VVSTQCMLRFLSLILVFASLPAHSQIKNIDDAVYKANRLGMLSQRIGKTYIAQALKVEDVKSKKILEDSIAQFDRSLVELKVYAPTSELKSIFAELDTRWRTLKDTVVGAAPSAASCKTVIAADRSTLELATKASKALQARSQKASTKLVEIAESGAMLSQRTAQYYFAALMEVDTAKSIVELDKAELDFVNQLQFLKSSKDVPSRLRASVSLVESQWAFVEKAGKNRSDFRNRIALAGNMLKASERVLEVMEELAVNLETP
jgi:Type IV pili methyl-accepting chemotaxis transducer N-term